MSDKSMTKRAELENEIRQIIDHEGALDQDMVERLESCESEVRTIDNQLREESARERAGKLLKEPRHTTPSMGRATTETTSAANDVDGYVRWWRSLGQDGTELRDNLNLGDSAVVPNDLLPELSRLFGSVSGVRNAVSVSQMPNGVTVPTVTTRVSVTAITAEGTAFDNVQPVFGSASFDSDSTKTAAANTDLTVQVMQDSRVDLIREVTTQHAEEIARFWSAKYATGLDDGGSPATVYTDPIFDATNSDFNTKSAAGAAVIAASELIEMRYSTMPPQWWAANGGMSWVMGADTFGHVMGLLDGNDRPIFQSSADSTLASPMMGTLLGLPVYIESGAPSLATGNATVALINKGAYKIVDRSPGLITQINPWAQHKSGIVEVNSFYRSCGRILQPEGITLLIQA